MQHAGVLVTVGPSRPFHERDGSVWYPTEAWWRFVLVYQLWQFTMYLDRDIAGDPNDPQWRALVREAGQDWDEQRPAAMARRVLPESSEEDNQDDWSTGRNTEHTTGW